MREGACFALASALAACATLLAPAAHAAEDPRLLVDQPPFQHLGTLEPGDSLLWEIGTHVEGAPSAELDLQLRAWGSLVEHADGLMVQVDACAAGETRCGTNIVARSALRDVATEESSGTWHIMTLSDDDAVTLEVTLALPTTATTVDGLEGNIAVGLFASGTSDEDPGERDPGDDEPDEEHEDDGTDEDDEPDDGSDEEPDDELPLTGLSVGSLLVLAVALSVIGAVMRGRAGRSRG